MNESFSKACDFCLKIASKPVNVDFFLPFFQFAQECYLFYILLPFHTYGVSIKDSNDFVYVKINHI